MMDPILLCGERALAERPRENRSSSLHALAAFLRYIGSPDETAWDRWSLPDLLATWRTFRLDASMVAREAAAVRCGSLGRLLTAMKGGGWRPRLLQHRDCRLLQQRPLQLSDSLLGTRLLRLYPQRRVQQAVLQHLGTILQGLDWEAFGRLDGPELDDLVVRRTGGLRGDQRRALRAFVFLCRRHPLVDEHSRFATHLHAVPRAFMDEWPVLWEYPHHTARWLLRNGYGHDETGHLLWLVETGALNRRRATAEALRRSRASTARMVAQWTTLRKHFDARASAQPWSALLGVRASADDLYQTMGRIIGAHCMHTRPRRLVCVDGRNNLPDLLRGWVQLLIRSEVFHCIPPDLRLSNHALWRAREELAANHPSRYRLLPPRTERVVKVSLTAESVQQTLAVVSSARERLLLLLLSTLGLRVGAIAAMRVVDVWDAETQSVRTDWSLLEKGGCRRLCRPAEPLRESVRAYVGMGGEHEGISPLLFPPKRNPMVPRRSTVLRILQTVLRRAGLPHAHNPHQFRKLLINQLLSHWSLEDGRGGADEQISTRGPQFCCQMDRPP